MKKKKQQQNARIVVNRIQATPTIREYLRTLQPEEAAALQQGTNKDIAQHARADLRIGYLLTAYFHIHSIQQLLTADIEIMLDRWGLWLKGVRPAMTSIEQSDEKFARAMREICNPDKYYAMDVDSLYQKFMRWEGLQTTWAPGQPVRIESVEKNGDDETLVVENEIESCRITAVDVDAEKPHKCWRVARMNDDETVLLGKNLYFTLPAARGVATKLAKTNPGEIYVVYEQRDRLRLRPVDYKRVAKDSE